jgi:DNA-binding CsgD family transcriptional regulator
VAIESGISLAMAGDDGGLERIRQGIDIATEVGDDARVSLGHSQIGTGYGELRRYDIAMPALRTGIEFARAREYVSSELYESAWLARCELETGDWDAAGRRADALARSPRCVGNTRLVVLLVLAWLRGRRGDPGVRAMLDEALDIARSTQHIQRLWPVAACRAEHAWVVGHLDAELDVVSEALAMATRLRYRPAIEELSHWLTIADGTPRGDTAEAATAFGLSAAGDFEAAASRWSAIGCPYEEAMARFHVGTPGELAAAHATFVRMGAAPMRDRSADRQRRLGNRVPRGANQSTRENPLGLTDREVEVLALLPSGMTNAEIGDALFISTKTAGNHVSNVLAKLGVGTRAEAAVVAERLGLTGGGT